MNQRAYYVYTCAHSHYITQTYLPNIERKPCPQLSTTVGVHMSPEVKYIPASRTGCATNESAVFSVDIDRATTI